VYNSKATEQNIINSIGYLKSKHVNLKDDRIHFVIARYDNPHINVVGPTNTVQSAISTAWNLKLQIDQEN